nr:MAG TPA: hypothetical protein [Caudoviricetes sp.]DAU01060.1 MAG TPA: hypothetical protein [Caudoviricetes sp.]
MSFLAGVTARGVLYLSLPPWFPPRRVRSPPQTLWDTQNIQP